MSTLPLALTAAIVVVSEALAGPAWSQQIEPPPEAPEGVDYAVEPADSLAEGDVELGLGAAGRLGEAPTRRRRVRFSGGDLSGAVREGRSDPLAGGSVDGRGRLGTFTVGRLAPRWGRGLVFGAAGDPWQREALDRGATAAFRGRSGEGIRLRRGIGEATEMLCGRFSRRRLAAVRARRGSLALGAVSDGRRTHQYSAALSRGDGDVEMAWDHAGRWRAELLLERSLGHACDGPHPSAGWSASLRARAGSATFTSLAEAGRRGPAQALAAGLDGPGGRARLSVLGALWRFRPGVAGARAALALDRPLAHHGVVALGIEEQRGSRRDGDPGSRAALAAFRQGWWGEWWSGDGALALGLRNEGWGERPWARGAVRSVTSARLEARGPAGIQLGVTHSIYRVKRGESLYLPEAETDRLVLRAVSGEGARTRVEARSPFAGGRMRAAMHLVRTSDRPVRPQWTLDWTRRARLRGTPGARRD